MIVALGFVDDAGWNELTSARAHLELAVFRC
jgi:hypothetical protein